MHMWRVQWTSFGERGTATSYRCELCLEVRVVAQGEPHPEEV